MEDKSARACLTGLDWGVQSGLSRLVDPLLSDAQGRNAKQWLDELPVPHSKTPRYYYDFLQIFELFCFDYIIGMYMKLQEK